MCEVGRKGEKEENYNNGGGNGGRMVERKVDFTCFCYT